jgi:ATP-dependent helicase/nuclease subunit A
VSAPGSSKLRARDEAVWCTAQQEFARPLVVEAGAGTGKTSLLVARCLAWTLGPGWERALTRLGAVASPDRVAADVLARIAALTFTEAAVAEMAMRLGKALAEVAKDELPPGVVPSALPADRELRRERANALLGALDRLQVRTIHAFCRRLLAQHAIAAGLHPQLEVDAEGLTARAVAREVVDAAVRAGYAEPGDADLITLGVDGIGPPELERALVSLLEKGIPEAAIEAEPFVAERIRSWTTELVSLLQPFEEFPELARRGTELSCLTLDAIASCARRLATPASSVEELDGIAAALRDAWPENLLTRVGEWSRGVFKQSDQKTLGGGQAALARAARALRPFIVQLRDLHPLALDRLHRVLAKLLARAREHMRLRGAIGYSDLLRGARDLLRDQPAVRARARAEIDQLLIDEFQDTDRVQCEILRWLALDGPASERPGLFLVGDPKQSIYGWREADLRAYEAFAAEALGPGGEPERLFVNRRSTPAILAEVERVIAPVMRVAAGVQPAFQPLVPDPEREPVEGGGVEHVVSWEWDDEEGALRHPNASAAARLEAAAIVADLARLRSGGGFEWQHAGLLLRTTTDLEVYLAALRDAGIPYAVERDRTYYQRREVIDATALVSCVLDPADELALLTWLRSPAVGVPDAALLPLFRGLVEQAARLTGDGDAELLAALDLEIDAAAAALPDDVPGLDRVAGWHHSLRHALGVISRLRASYADDATDVFVEKLRALSLLEASEASRYLGPYRVANLACFFRDLRDGLEADDVDVQALLRRLRGDVANEREREEPRPPDAGSDAVRVMTIHQAKGLEFRHCYVAQLHKQPGRGRREDPVEIREHAGCFEYRYAPQYGPVWTTLGFARVKAYQDEVAAAEQVRSLYVAATRARDRLVLLGDRRDGEEAKDPEQATCHAQLLESRAGEAIDLAAEMARARREGRDSLLDGDGVRWIFPGLRDGASLERGEAAADASLPSVDALAAEAAQLAALRDMAERRMQRPFRVAASAESRAEANEEEAERRFESAARTGAPPGLEAEAARAAGTALHRVLETLPLDGDLRAALARARDRLPELLASLGSPELRAAALERARETLARFADGPLPARLAALAGAVLARELPVLIPASPEGEGAVGFVAGAIDLLHADPESGETVIVDYKTDRLEPGAALEEHASRYAGQAAHYRRAVQEALALAKPPRCELWFLHSGAVVPIA